MTYRRNTAMALALAGTVLGGSRVAAADLALVIGVGDQRAAAIPDTDGAADLATRRDAYRDAGFSLIRVSNPGASGIDQALAEIRRRAADADRMLVVLAGRFVHAAGETWLLPSDITDLDPSTAAESGLPLSVVLAWMAQRPGEAILALGTDETAFDAGPFLSPGLGRIDPPQGVTLLTGTPRAIGRIVERGVLAEGVRLADRIAADGEVTAEGFLPADFVFLPGDTAAPPTPDAGAAEQAYWRATRDLDTIAAYETYLDAYPDGRYRADARAAIDAVRNRPAAQARQAEAALNLTRSQRQQIQRDLSILDYDTRGIDGIFGPGTRAAIERWQGDQNLTATGYVDRQQVRRLANLADARAIELEAEADARRAALAREDEATWNRTGRGGSEDGLRAYLDAYPEGLYADLAAARLQEIEDDKRARAQATERAAWDAARATDRVDAYRAYLDSYPSGAFTEEARARIDDLQGVGKVGANAEAAAAEQALGLSAITRRAIEDRLAKLNYQPGAVDGQFDDDTRRALRRYQSDRDLTQTGYLNQATVVRILADSVRSILD